MNDLSFMDLWICLGAGFIALALMEYKKSKPLWAVRIVTWVNNWLTNNILLPVLDSIILIGTFAGNILAECKQQVTLWFSAIANWSKTGKSEHKEA